MMFARAAGRYVPITAVGSELLFEVISRRYENGATMVTSNLPFDEWTSVFGSERLTGALLDRLPHHVHILEMNGESYRLAASKKRARKDSPIAATEATAHAALGDLVERQPDFLGRCSRRPPGLREAVNTEQNCADQKEVDRRLAP